MGMDQRIEFPARSVPTWPEVAGLLARRGYSVQMRMIDGELAFPDEEPPEGWREIRVGASGAMVTIRRQPEQVVLVAWGNADRDQRELWNALAWAWAESGAGLVQTPEGALDATSFAAKAELPAALGR
jgi:hypothetical protein